MGKRARSPSLELKLNLSPPREADQSSALSTLSSVSTHSWEGSCVSSEAVENTRAMLVLGCPRCLMYVMLSGVDPNPKCPKCKSTVLLDVLNTEENNTKTSTC